MNNNIDTSKAVGIYFKKTGESWEYHPKEGDKFSQKGEEIDVSVIKEFLDKIAKKLETK